MPQCLIPNCNNKGVHNLAVRLRRPDTTAIWAPNSEAFLCDLHAENGYIVDVTLRPSPAREITTNFTAGGHIETRTTNIIHHP